MGHAARQPLRLSEVARSTDASDQRRQRRNRLHRKLVDPSEAHSECATDYLPRRKPWLAVPVSRTLRHSCCAVSLRIGMNYVHEFRASHDRITRALKIRIL